MARRMFVMPPYLNMALLVNRSRHPLRVGPKSDFGCGAGQDRHRSPPTTDPPTTAPAPTSRCPQYPAATYDIDPNQVADTGGGAQLVTVVAPSTSSWAATFYGVGLAAGPPTRACTRNGR